MLILSYFQIPLLPILKWQSCPIRINTWQEFYLPEFTQLLMSQDKNWGFLIPCPVLLTL
jgi:hypothetical protein